MDPNRRSGKSLALDPVERARAAADDDSSQANPQRDLRMTSADEFLAAAAKEYESGNIDQALWRRAADQCRGDASLVIAAYLRARATALQLRHKPDELAPSRTRGVDSRRDPRHPEVEAEPETETASADSTDVRGRFLNRKSFYLAGAVTALVAAAAVAYVAVSPRDGESARQRIAATATASSDQSAAENPPVSRQAIAKDSSGATRTAASAPPLATTVQQLKAVGNWNVLVLYATEWTRKEPGNADAWNELGVGYAKLRQFNEALDAATKAVQLAPANPVAWRNLGQINLAVDRLPEAGFAFDRALAVSPDDADARCGAALVAQRQARPKDADAIALRVRTAEGSCLDLVKVETTAVVPIGSARKPVSPAGR